MKRIFLPVVALIMSTTLILSGCGTKSSSFYDSNVEAKDVSYTSYTDLSVALDGATIDKDTITRNGSAVVTKDIDGATYYGVFNLLDGKYTYALEKVYGIEIIIQGDEDAFKIKYDVEGNERYKIVYESGEVVYENLEEVEYIGRRTVKKVVYEAWKFRKDGFNNLEVLKIKKGKRIVNFTTNNAIGNEITPTDYIWGGGFSSELVNYVISVRLLSNGNSLYTVLNKKGKAVAEYEMDINNLNAVIIVGGSMIVQYVYPVDAYSTKFDFFEDGEKKQIETLKVNIKNGKVKKLSKVDCLIESQMISSENFSRIRIREIDNKILGSTNDGFIDGNGKITEVKYAYERVMKITDNKLVAENNNEEMPLFQIIDVDGNVLVDLTAVNADYDYINHCDKFIIIRDVNTNKFAMMDLTGKLLTGFVYDESLGVANDVWLASKVSENTNKSERITTYFTIDASGAELKQSEKKVNSNDDTLISNALGEKAIVELSAINEHIAVVKSNSEQVGLFNYSLYALNDFTTPLTSFANVSEWNIETYQISQNCKNILVFVNGQVGILR